MAKGIVLIKHFALANQTSLQTKLLVTFVPLIVLILGCFLVYVNWYIVNPLKEKTIGETLQSAVKVQELLDEYINVQNQLSQRILSNKDIFTTLAPNPDKPLNNLVRNRILRDIMFQALGPSIDIQDMMIYNPDGNFITSYIGQSEPESLYPIIQDETYGKKLINSNFILYTEKPDTFAFIRAIMDKDGIIYGYLYILLDNTYLQKVANSIIGSEVYVIDSEASPIVMSGETKNRYELMKYMKSDVPDSGIETDSMNNFIAYQQSDNTGWTAVVRTSRASVLGYVDSVKNISFLLIVTLSVISFIYLYFSARNFVLPIRRLRSQILRMNYSNLNLKTDSFVYNNDLQLLNEAFSELLERLQDSIEREKLAVHEEVMARNSALQAHIAPHFIHNALYLISIASQEGKNETVSMMCSKLSASLRYIVSSPYQHVTIHDELEHTKRYLALVQQNYEDDLKWVIDIDSAASAIQLPRLVIQPFVENCIEHAFHLSDPPWHIHIKVKLFNGLWAVEIKDNGIGIRQEEIDSIMEQIQESDHGIQEMKGHMPLGIGKMGIVNTINRLKLMYKNKLIFNLYRNVDGGTTVQIIASMGNEFY